jgi:hypothetical protein
MKRMLMAMLIISGLLVGCSEANVSIDTESAKQFILDTSGILFALEDEGDILGTEEVDNKAYEYLYGVESEFYINATKIEKELVDITLKAIEIPNSSVIKEANRKLDSYIMAVAENSVE